ncbi:hypothetical protein P9112_011862 [Eukaryota sp. TZLM1-RC]
MDLLESYTDICQRLQQAAMDRQTRPTLVAVSKTKSQSLIQKLYDFGHRDFGENYAQELCEKASALPNDITWHFIGPCQSNKVKSVAQISHLVVHTIDRVKIASKFSEEASRLGKVIPVFVQVNISSEASKSGVLPGEEALELCRFVLEHCTYLKLNGLMTIGKIGDVSAFEALRNLADTIALKLGHDMQCSMGMSGDFEDAVRFGSDVVRIGSSIFGKRAYF